MCSSDLKTLNDYMAMSYRMEIVEDKDEGGFVVSYPDLPGCITCGETVESAVANALDAKKAWIEAALKTFTIIILNTLHHFWKEDTHSIDSC